MMPHRLLFWVIVGIIIGFLLIMMANQLIVNMINVNVNIGVP